MRIGIDVRCFAQGKNTGVEEYAQRALDAIFKIDHENEYVLFFNAWHGQKVDFSWATQYKNVKLKKFSIPNKLLNFSLWFLRYPKLDKLCGGVDVFFMPNNNFYALSNNVKLFLTIHDLSFEHYKKSFSFKRRMWHFFVNPRLLAQRADHIFVVSEATKTDLLETYGISSQKISVTPNGMTSVSGNYDRNNIDLIAVKKKYNLPYKFILYFGTIEPRKNIVNIIKAFDELLDRKNDIEYKLVIAGANGWKGEKIFKAIGNAKYSKKIMILTDIPEEEKEIFYTLSSIFVYPSFFEGFGFPPLEAIACGIPTITSYTTSLPEVVENKAIMINPMRPSEIAEALMTTITDKKVQTNLTKDFDEYIKKFQWNIFAKKFKYFVDKN